MHSGLDIVSRLQESLVRLVSLVLQISNEDCQTNVAIEKKYAQKSMAMAHLSLLFINLIARS